MKVEHKNFRFNRVVSRGFILGIFLSILMGPWSALATPQGDASVSRGEFVAMIASHQPDNPMLPMGSLRTYLKKSCTFKRSRICLTKGYPCSGQEIL